MLKNNEKNYYQNLCVLAFTVVLFSLVLGATVQNAKESKVNPKPTPQKSPSPKKTATPKKTANTNSNSSKSTNSNKSLSNKSANSNKSVSNSNKKSNLSSKTPSNSNKSSNSNKMSSNKSKSATNTTKTNSNSNKSSANSNKSSKSNSNSNKSAANPNKSIVSNKSTTNPSKPAVSYPQVIVTSISARVRSSSNSSATELRRVKLGTLLNVVGKQSGWYQVQNSGVKASNGWISISSADDFDVANREEIYRQLIDKFYKDEMDFNTASELFEFLTRASNEIKSKTAADIELKRLLSLRAALNSIQMENISKTQKDFIKATESKIIYSEPAGAWLVRSELFWDLHKKYKDNKDAEKLAWIATKNPLAGECEGYVNCYLFILRATDGEYLNIYPTGENSGEALKNIANMLEPIMQDLKDKVVYNGPTDVSDRAEFNRLISELRSILSKLATTDKDKPIQQLEAIAEAFR